MLNKRYYTYQDLMELLSCSKRTLERKLPSMNIRKLYFGGKGKPYFLVVDVHAYMIFNQSYEQLTQSQKDRLRDLLNE